MVDRERRRLIHGRNDVAHFWFSISLSGSAIEFLWLIRIDGAVVLSYYERWWVYYDLWLWYITTSHDPQEKLGRWFGLLLLLAQLIPIGTHLDLVCGSGLWNGKICILFDAYTNNGITWTKTKHHNNKQHQQSNRTNQGYTTPPSNIVSKKFYHSESSNGKEPSVINYNGWCDSSCVCVFVWGIEYWLTIGPPTNEHDDASGGPLDRSRPQQQQYIE